MPAVRAEADVTSPRRQVSLDRTQFSGFFETLARSVEQCGPDFAGLGLVICRDLSRLPYVQMHHRVIADDQRCVATIIADAGRRSRPYHDGFHVLSEQLVPLKWHVYLSPPINGRQPPIPAGTCVGSRYYTAFFTSQLPMVSCCVTISEGKQLFLFSERGVSSLSDLRRPTDQHLR